MAKQQNPNQRVPTPRGTPPRNAERGPQEPRTPHSVGNTRPDPGVEPSHTRPVKPPTSGGRRR